MDDYTGLMARGCCVACKDALGAGWNWNGGSGADVDCDTWQRRVSCLGKRLGNRAGRVVDTTSTGTSVPNAHLVVGLRQEETRKSEGRRALIEHGSQNGTEELSSAVWGLLVFGESIHKAIGRIPVRATSDMYKPGKRQHLSSPSLKTD
jgi:hypothetical protein